MILSHLNLVHYYLFRRLGFCYWSIIIFNLRYQIVVTQLDTQKAYV